MELTGETRIAAPRDAVWEALNDPAVLGRCIEGVESLERMTDDAGRTRFEGTIHARIGPVRATVTGDLTITDPEPPHRYVLVGEGKFAGAGFARGRAGIGLAEDGDATLLTYAVTVTGGGNLAQAGSRLIATAGNAYAATFCARLKAELERPVPAASAAVTETAADPQAIPAAEAARGGLPPLVWGGGLVFGVVALLAWQLS